jgi:hypothetical protein
MLTERMLTESDVINAVCDYLSERYFTINSRCTETERGIDIDGVTPDRSKKITVEAKGETSSKDHTARYGKAFNSGQVADHVSKAFYAAARDCSKGLEAAIAFPKNQAHLSCVAKILPALRRLEIEVFWVSSNKTVEVEGNWKIWPVG